MCASFGRFNRQVHFAAQQTPGQAVAVERADGVRDAGEHLAISFSSFGATLAQSEDRIFAPWSRTRDVGPKQPVQGMLPVVQALAAAARGRPHADDALRQEAEIRGRAAPGADA